MSAVEDETLDSRSTTVGAFDTPLNDETQRLWEGIGHNWPMTNESIPSYSIAILVDRRGWVLIQQRDANAAKQPLKWACIGGAIGVGESPDNAAYRELAQQAGISLSEGLSHFSTEVFTWSTGTVAEYHTFVGATDLVDDDVVLGSGQRIIFVDPVTIPSLDFTESGAHVLQNFLGSATHRELSAR